MNAPQVTPPVSPFSVHPMITAGRRAGLAGERTGLFWEGMRIVRAIRPRFVLLENVVGLLSSNQRRDFPVVVGTLADLGYGVAWRVVNSQYFGVPQRRRRVFILGALVEGRAGAERAGEVLSVGSRCERHPAAGTKAGKGAAAGSPPGSRGYCEVGGVSETVTSKWRKGTGGPAGNECQNLTIANALDRMAGGADDNDAQARHLVSTVTHTLRAEGFDASEDGTGRGTPLVAHTLTSGGHSSGVSAPGRRKEGDVNLAPTGTAGVRRLTPVECCRLQGFPDDWFGRPNERPDAPRYAALGDAVTVTVAEWLGRRILRALREEDEQ